MTEEYPPDAARVGMLPRAISGIVKSVSRLTFPAYPSGVEVMVTDEPVPSLAVYEEMVLDPGTQSESMTLAALNWSSLIVFCIVRIF